MSSSNAFLDLTETLDTLDACVGVMDDFDSVEIESVIVGFSNDPKFRYALIEWVAKSHNNHNQAQASGAESAGLRKCAAG